jgi:hypothetical protein
MVALVAVSVCEVLVVVVVAVVLASSTEITLLALESPITFSATHEKS